MNQLTILPNATPEQQEAAEMHFEIIQAAKAAVNSLLDLGRKLKRMRDSGRYKDLGFGTFAEYTEAAVGIKQRQAYNYISVVESLPARLIEENAAAGVTKLALLAKLNPEDREDLTGDTLASITVAELKKLVEERDSMAQQLSMFQEAQQVETVAEVDPAPSQPVDVEEIRRQAAEEMRLILEKEHRNELEKMEAAKAEAVNAATMKAEQAAASEVRKAKQEAAAKAAEETAQKVKKAAEEAARAAAEAQEAKDRQQLEQARQAEAEAKKEAEALAKQMQLNADEDGVRFVLLFEQMQDKVEAMQDLAKTMREAGKDEQAAKYMAALCGALSAMQANLEGGAA